MSTSRARRINARLPPEAARKVSYLERQRNLSTTQVLLECIEHYYAAVTDDEGAAAERLTRAGFVGCATGAVDLSSSYKSDLTTSLQHKT